MIVILEKYQMLQKLFGLDPHGVRANILARIIFSVLLILSVLLPSIFLVLNFREDTHHALSTVPPLFGFVATVLNYFHLVINRERIYSLLKQLQDIATESMYKKKSIIIFKDRFKLYLRSDSKMYFFQEQISMTTAK